MALLCANNDIPSVVKPANGTDFQLQELYKLLNCQTIQVIPVSNGRIMILDEEGKCKPNYRNNHATLVAHGAIADTDYIAGHALVCKESELK